MDAHFKACSTLHKQFYFMLPIELLYIFLTILYMCFGAEDTLTLQLCCCNTCRMLFGLVSLP